LGAPASFVRKGEVLAYVELSQNLKDPAKRTYRQIYAALLGEALALGAPASDARRRACVCPPSAWQRVLRFISEKDFSKGFLFKDIYYTNALPVLF